MGSCYYRKHNTDVWARRLISLITACLIGGLVSSKTTTMTAGSASGQLISSGSHFMH